jgi:hypothetical protein
VTKRDPHRGNRITVVASEYAALRERASVAEQERDAYRATLGHIEDLALRVVGPFAEEVAGIAHDALANLGRERTEP